MAIIISWLRDALFYEVSKGADRGIRAQWGKEGERGHYTCIAIIPDISAHSNLGEYFFNEFAGAWN